MLNLTKVARSSGGKDTLVILTDSGYGSTMLERS